MSIQAVTGRIDQILTMRQELMNPQAAASAGSAGQTSAATGSSGANFSAALASAQAATGTTPVATAADLSGIAASTAGGTASGTAATQVQSMVNMANSLLGKPYVLGGGHAGFAPSSGYDCSGFVSAVLHAGGYLSQPADTTAMPSQAGILPGRGQYVTIYDRALPGENGHVIIEINGQFYESGGSAGPWGGGGGVEKIGRPSDAYLAQFPTVLHPSGL
jgi:cell wall-associated NlpC family hydrolase